jgi:hypothetical protein
VYPKRRFPDDLFLLVALVSTLAGCGGDDSDTSSEEDPNAPACATSFEEVTFLQTDGTSAELFLDGDTAYVSDSFGLRVLDVSDPAAPAELTYYELAMPILYFNDLSARDGVAYVAGGIQGLITLDISTPSAPGYLATAFDGMPDGQHDALSIALVDDLALTAENARGMHVYDVGDPSSPEEIGVSDFTMSATNEIAARDGLAVVDDGATLHFVDLSSPASPSLAATFSEGLQSESRGLLLDGERLYFGNGKNLLVLDVADPGAPAVLSTTPLDDSVEDLFLEGGCLYAGHTNGAFTAIDVKVPAAPMPSPHVDSFGVLDTLGIAARGEWVFVASRDQGLRVYRATEAGAQN